jgi:hypothetical protein
MPVQYLQVAAKMELDGYLRFDVFLSFWVKIRAQSAGIYKGFGTHA